MDNFNNNNFNQNQGYAPPVQQKQPTQNYQNYQQPNYQNSNGSLNYPTNGTPTNRPVPTTGWNWGAAMYGWIWGLANGTWMPLLGLIPVLNMFWWIVCGIKGNEWAMSSGMWRTVEEFNAVQKSWNRAGKFMFWFTVIFLIIYFVFIFGVIGLGVFSELLSSSYYY